MGKFKFSELIRKAWFCKSKRQDGNPRKKKQIAAAAASSPDPKQSTYNVPVARKSYHFARERFPGVKFTTRIPDPPKESERGRSGCKSRRSSPRLGNGCRERVPWGKTLSPVYPIESSDDTELAGPVLPELRFDSVLPTESSDGLASWASGSGSSSSKSLNLRPEPGRHFLPHLELPPIVTKAGGCKKHKTKRSPRVLVHPPGVRLRVNSPRVGHSRRMHGRSRKSASSKSFSESFALVKSSANPEEDFRESMMEMIVHNNIWSSRDLEELLACYLSLNSLEYHPLIISVFKQICVDLTTFSVA